MSPVVVDVFVCLHDLAVERYRGSGVGSGHGDDGVDRVGLVVGHDQHGPRDDSAHGVSQDDDRCRIGQVGVSVGCSWVEVQREDVANGFVEILSLVEEGLAMEGGDVLVEVDGEEVQASCASLDRSLVMLQDVVEIIGCFCGDWSDLLVASGVAGDEQDGDAPDLRQSAKPRRRQFECRVPLTFVS